ncbi:MAG: LpxI family protein, partial [Terriglobales bacterium]
MAADKYGLIAGNGRFPFLLLEAARGRGLEMVVAAIKEETEPSIAAQAAEVHWLGLGQLGKLIQIFHSAGVRRAVMAGQVKHKQIFSHLRPDWKMAMLLASLATRNTDSLLGGVARVLEDSGITLESSTQFLQPLLATQGPMTARDADARERADLEYGFSVARHLAAMDIGQAVAIAECACVAAEAMEGTDAMIARSATLAGGRPLTIVKVAKPKQDLRFDVPVVGPGTIAAMRAAGATALGVESGITLLL